MKKECAACGGTGQIGFFQGVSRFLITWEECLECLGTGYVELEQDRAKTNQMKRTDKNSSGKSKKK